MKTAAELDERWVRNFNASQQRMALKERAVAYLGGKCTLCPYDRCLSALEFHHRDPREKDFVISSKMSWEALVRELEKTVLVCSNCHREIHAGLHPHLLDREDESRV